MTDEEDKRLLEDAAGPPIWGPSPLLGAYAAWKADEERRLRWLPSDLLTDGPGGAPHVTLGPLDPEVESEGGEP